MTRSDNKNKTRRFFTASLIFIMLFPIRKGKHKLRLLDPVN